MQQKTTNILLTTNGEIVVNDFNDERCPECVQSNSAKGRSMVKCPLSGENRRIVLKAFSTDKLYICDNRGKHSN